VPLVIALLAAAVLVAAGFARMLLRERRLTGELAGLTERIQELSARMEATEADVAHSVTQSEITETLLLEKGIADEEDLEAARRRFDGGDPPPSSSRYTPERDGDLH
jgi:hypothetical protein